MKISYVVLFILFSIKAYGFADMGVGLNSAVNGRSVLGLSASSKVGSYDLSLFSIGVQTTTYYQSNYVVNVLKTWKAGDFLFGDVEAGFGFGVFYTKKGFRDTGGGTLDEKSEVGFGPSLQMKWFIFGPVFLNLEALFGLKDLATHLQLSFQDVVSLSVGVRF